MAYIHFYIKCKVKKVSGSVLGEVPSTIHDENHIFSSKLLESP